MKPVPHEYDSLPTTNETLGTLLVEFFEFYSIFNFGENIISVFEGIAFGPSIREAENDDNSFGK